MKTIVFVVSVILVGPVLADECTRMVETHISATEFGINTQPEDSAAAKSGLAEIEKIRRLRQSQSDCEIARGIPGLLGRGQHSGPAVK